jgi:starch phosphorylase
VSAGYRPAAELDHNEELRRVIDCVAQGAFSGGDRDLFRPLVDNLVFSDPFLVLADYAAYAECQRKVSAAFADPRAWARKSVLNVARTGWFSSDRSIREYCERVWRVGPVKPPEPEAASPPA